MKALKEQIPVESNDSKLPTNRVGTLFAVCRKLQQRLAKVEAELGNVRRDVWRIDRRAYVDKGKQPVNSGPHSVQVPQPDSEMVWLESILKE